MGFVRRGVIDFSIFSIGFGLPLAEIERQLQVNYLGAVAATRLEEGSTGLYL